MTSRGDAALVLLLSRHVTEMAGEQRSRLLEILDELAATEQHDARRYEMRFFPFAIGLIDTEPDEAKPLHRQWIQPQNRIAGPVIKE